MTRVECCQTKFTGARDDDVHVADDLVQLHHPESIHAVHTTVEKKVK